MSVSLALPDCTLLPNNAVRAKGRNRRCNHRCMHRDNDRLHFCSSSLQSKSLNHRFTGVSEHCYNTYSAFTGNGQTEVGDSPEALRRIPIQTNELAVIPLSITGLRSFLYLCLFVSSTLRIDEQWAQNGDKQERRPLSRPSSKLETKRRPTYGQVGSAGRGVCVRYAISNDRSDRSGAGATDALTLASAVQDNVGRGV